MDALRGRGDALPAGLFGYVWAASARRQLALAGLSIAVFALSAVPLELQRRIVNDAIHAADYQPILWLALAYVGVAAALAIGGWYVLQGRIEVGTVVAFVSGLAKVNDPWGDVVNWFRDMTINRVKYRLISSAMGRISGAD